VAWTTPKNCTFLLRDLHPHLIHGSLDPLESSSKRPVNRFSHFCTVHRRVSHYGSLRFTHKCPYPLGDRVHITHSTNTAHPSHQLKRHLDRLRCLRMAHKCYAIQCIVHPQNYPFPLDLVTPPEEDRATVMDNMHKNGKDRLCGSGNVLADRQTDRQTDTHTDVRIIILSTAPAGEVTIW